MRVGVAQVEPRLGETERNLEACVARIEEAAAAGCRLVVFPECAISGYMFDSPAEAAAFAQEVPGPATEVLSGVCGRLGMHAVCGMLERAGDALFNTAVLVGPDGPAGRYRKTHLPFLGVDRFTTPGDELCVVDTSIGRVGVEICYDLRFPELTRSLALAGAEIVAHPTNWPVQVRSLADFVTRARAAENRVFLLTANRVGRERGAEFFGWSQIVDPLGVRLAEAGATEEGLVVSDVELAEARVKDIQPVPGEYEMHLFDDRRPELYRALVEEPATARAR
jgi:predicted amidohydrolase